MPHVRQVDAVLPVRHYDATLHRCIESGKASVNGYGAALASGSMCLGSGNLCLPGGMFRRTTLQLSLGSE